MARGDVNKFRCLGPFQVQEEERRRLEVWRSCKGRDTEPDMVIVDLQIWGVWTLHACISILWMYNCYTYLSTSFFPDDEFFVVEKVGCMKKYIST